MLQIGDIQVLILSDGFVHIDAGGPFGLVPRALYKRYLMPDEENCIPMMLTCLLVRAAGKNIVVDTGLGDKLSDRMKAQWRLERPEGLVQGLARFGVRPEDVDIVIDTHLHADHCSGNTIHGPDGKTILPTFPKAEYVVQRREHYDAIRPNERTRATYLAENFQPLVESGQMRLLDGDMEIVPGVRCVVTPGHTPGLQVVVFEGGGQSAVFVTDLAAYAVHFERLGWMTSYDVEPLITLETKRVWQNWALETNATLIFQHDPNVVTARYVQDGERRVVQKLDMGWD